ncbi:hypothetical protein GPEL0_01f3624 [Geoanaerobacter pelophilus]|uniref:SH3 domain-containing protein n=1 Tax=Geoanaerobacter pelophilus TaxID=60036 RepID=A0ABQ0MKP8_9BACT|nr:hypothetical protein [Geoanaerobacter pelophilus]GAW67667.1 hypothetical protein GPEL0_01f3624 [Geoanaerobacter pelophilus]
MRLSASLLLIALAAGAAYATPPAPRPYSGCGILKLRQWGALEPEPLALYREPGLLRVAEKSAAALPRLAGDGFEPLLAASERRGRWTRLSLDDAGRQGWLEQQRGWDYASWDEFLPGRTVRVLPGLKKGWYSLKGAPAEDAAEIASLTRDQLVQVMEVEEDWVKLERPSGWFRWRDPDGRLTVSLQSSR